MHNIPKFFLKPRTQKGDAVVSPTKQILTPEELDKLKNKIKTEVSTAEIKIEYLLNQTTPPKERELKEIKALENNIRSLKAKYAELIDPTVSIYKTKKQLVVQPDQASAQGLDKPSPTKVVPAKSSAKTLFDSIDEVEEGATALTTKVKERRAECAKCHAPIVLSVTTDKEQCILHTV